MAKYRKKPVVVEAVQYNHPSTAPSGVFIGIGGEAWVVTIHGQAAKVVPGDWIISEVDGEHHYPCKPWIFEATYEKVEG